VVGVAPVRRRHQPFAAGRHEPGGTGTVSHYRRRPELESAKWHRIAVQERKFGMLDKFVERGLLSSRETWSQQTLFMNNTCAIVSRIAAASCFLRASISCWRRILRFHRWQRNRSNRLSPHWARTELE